MQLESKAVSGQPTSLSSKLSLQQQSSCNDEDDDGDFDPDGEEKGGYGGGGGKSAFGWLCTGAQPRTENAFLCIASDCTTGCIVLCSRMKLYELSLHSIAFCSAVGCIH